MRKKVDSKEALERTRAFKALQRDLGLTNKGCAKVLGVKLITVEKWRMGYSPPMPMANRFLAVLKAIREACPEFFKRLLKDLKDQE